MLRQLRKLVRSQRQRIVSAALLPALFLATLPHFACICGDGHRETICNSSACCALNSSACCALKEGDAARVRCSCCKTKLAVQRSCCLSKHGATDSVTAPVPGIGAMKGNCCHPIIESPAPALSAKRVAPESHLHLATVALPTFVSDETASNLSGSVFDFHGPPPRDVVIVFERLTI